jgi:protein translocase SecG subunit
MKLVGVIISIFLITIIFLQVPEENVGLASFTSRADLLGSPSSAQRFLKVLTAGCIFLYLGIALQLNLQST